MQRDENLIRRMINEWGISAGISVSWKPSFANRRYGCVLSTDGCKDGKVLIQASNAKLRISVSTLRVEPDCDDPITADQKGIYSELEA